MNDYYSLGGVCTYSRRMAISETVSMFDYSYFFMNINLTINVGPSFSFLQLKIPIYIPRSGVSLHRKQSQLHLPLIGLLTLRTPGSTCISNISFFSLTAYTRNFPSFDVLIVCDRIYGFIFLRHSFTKFFCFFLFLS